MKRSIGLVGLTFMAVGGIIGSGWLFGPLLAAQVAGPAAIISWIIGAVAMFILALTFAEISAMLPVPGGIARVPQFSHGTVVSMIMGWSAWIGYNTTAPIEVEVMLRYMGPYATWLHVGSTQTLTPAGIAVAAFALLMFTVINAFGVKFFAYVNTTLTWAKLGIPILLTVVLIVTHFDRSNFTNTGGFAPFGMHGVLAAVSSGGVIFSFIGFRHAIDMAGEVKNPKFTIPVALLLSIILCAAVYIGLQVAFVGGLSPSDLSKGWPGLNFGKAGPLDGVLMSVGILWFISILNIGAIIGPFGNALVSTGSNARLAMAMSRNGFLPKFVQHLSSLGVPLWALVVNFVIGLMFLLTIPFKEVVALNGASIVLSFVVGPIAVVALRQLAPDQVRSFKLPAVHLVALLAFIISTLVVYWSGWDTIWRLGLALLVGFALLVARYRKSLRDIDGAQALWLIPYLMGIGIISYLGDFGDGALNVIPFGWDMAICSIFSTGIFALALRSKLPQEKFEEYISEMKV